MDPPCGLPCNDMSGVIVEDITNSTRVMDVIHSRMDDVLDELHESGEVQRGRITTLEDVVKKQQDEIEHLKKTITAMQKQSEKMMCMMRRLTQYSQQIADTIVDSRETKKRKVDEAEKNETAIVDICDSYLSLISYS